MNITSSEHWTFPGNAGAPSSTGALSEEGRDGARAPEGVNREASQEEDARGPSAAQDTHVATSATVATLSRSLEVIDVHEWCYTDKILYESTKIYKVFDEG